MQIIANTIEKDEAAHTGFVDLHNWRRSDVILKRYELNIKKYNLHKNKITVIGIGQEVREANDEGCTLLIFYLYIEETIKELKEKATINIRFADDA